MAFEAGSYVWIPDDEEVVIPAKVEAAFSAGSPGTIKRLDNDRVIKLSAADTKKLSAMQAQCLEGVDDMVDFRELNEYSILHNLRSRYSSNIIYTNIGRILTSVNPFKMLPIYSPGVMDEYMEKGSRALPPHVFGVADDAFKAMIDNKKSQSCIVSGESGAGKTEATKVFLQYISEKSKRAAIGKDKGLVQRGHEMQQKILESNPLMEAFGNAKTVRNDNSSRFGKWIEVQFDRNSGAIVGGSIRSYLLEKSRIVNQANNERNYHIFYQLCSSAEIDPELEKYNVTDATQYYYLNQSEDPCTVVESIDDRDDWDRTMNAMDQIGITREEKDEIINVLSLILKIGNTTFTGKEVSAVDNKEVLKAAADALGTTPDALERALVKVDRSNPADPNLVGNHTVSQACDARDAFAKHTYALLFDWLIEKINISLGRVAESEKISTIGVLDIFGFEFFQNNSFEQLCINYCNEKLQGHFNDHIFKLEQEQYAKEGIDVTKIEFVDNENVIRTIDAPKTGILQIIADELKLNTATDETLLKKLKAIADETKNAVLSYPDNKEVKKDAQLDFVFRINHYAGQVGYRIEQFLEKNRDTVPTLLQKLGESSKNKFIQGLFKEKGAAKKQALGIRFSGQLNDLMKDLNATEPHYVRCVKPNSEKERDNFTSKMVLDQLRYAGLLEVCRIRQMGYPVRRTHDEFHKRFHYLVKAKTSNHKDLIAALEAEKLLDKKFYQIGTSKVFLKTGQADDLEERRAIALAKFVTTIQRVGRGYVARRRFKEYRKIITDLKKAIQSRDKNILRAALLMFGQLPYGGKHLSEYRNGQDLMNQIEDEERIAKLLLDAIATRDVNQIQSALQAAAQKKLENSKEAVEAKKLVELIQKEESCKAELRAALDKSDEAAVKNAVAKAKSLNLLECTEAKDAQVFLQVMEKERVCRGNLEAAIKAKDIAKIKTFMNQMADLGKKDDPLVQQGEEIVKEKAKEDAEIARKKEEILFQLAKAIENKNLQGLNDLEVAVIELGIDAPIVAEGKKLREKLQKERQLCARLNAEATAANAKAQTRVGLVPEDLDPLRKIIGEAEKVLEKTDDQLQNAHEDLRKLEAKLEAQKAMASALAEYKIMKQAFSAEKDNAKRDKITQDLLALLRGATQKAQDNGLDTTAAVEVREKLNTLQLDIDEKNRKANEEARKAKLAQLNEATQDDMDQDAIKRMQFNAQFTDLLSEKHRELIAESSDSTRYHLTRYYRIRSDEDFVQNIPPDQKEGVAKTKLFSRSKPITRSICRLDAEQNMLALRINRAILQYCGDLSTTFPATLAQYVLVRALEDPSMTDEIYIQICKHIQGNKKPDSEDKAWLLMCMCTKIFPPSQEFAPYLLNFLITRKGAPGLIGNYARLCIVQLDATIELGPTWFKPNLEEIQSYRKRPPILATIYTLENKPINYPVTPDMRVAQVLDLVRRKEAIDDDLTHPAWGIYVIAEEEREVETPKDRLIRFYKHYNPAKLAHVDLFLDHWKENPEELFEKLVLKYGPEPQIDDKDQKKGVLSLPITAAMNAVKFLGFTNQRDQPPAPETPWPLPWWTHLGDVYYRMTRQKKLPRFVFKRRLITRKEKVDKWLYLQAVDDIRKGYLPLTDANKIAKLAALAMKYEIDEPPVTVYGLKDANLAKFIPQNALASRPFEEYATLVSGIYKKNEIPNDKKTIMTQYVTACREIPIYGMNFFYARHAASDKNYVISVDVDGIHVLENDRSAIKRSFSFQTIKKFGATAEYFWMNIDERQEPSKSKFSFLSQNQGINVLLYTLQSWEMYDCVYDATHIDVD